MGEHNRGAECLIVGANGLVGQYLGRVLKQNKCAWHGTYYSRPGEDMSMLDVTDKEGVESLFSMVNPRVVFNCANLAGGVDFCETNPAKARSFHFDAVKNLADAASRISALFVFISTDYIFDGRSAPYKEGDAPNPLNLYGRLKLEAEEYVRRSLKKYIIIRTTNVFGWDPATKTPNYVMNMHRAIKSGKQVNAPSYLWGNPTYAGDLASAMAELYRKTANGVYHIVGSSNINRYEWARRACEILQLDFNLVREVKDPPQNIVPRPFRSLLNTEKFRASYGTILHDVSDGLNMMRSEITGLESSALNR